TIFDKELLFSIAPQDIKGLGTFTVHYDNGQYNDVWAYVREVRRTRRLTGASWMDAVGGTDWLTDDLLTFGAYPAWYESYNYLGRTTILGIAHAAVPVWDTSASTRRAEFPTLDVTSPPYWNFRETWEPRAVHVVEAIPPEEHPYLKKIMYVDAKTWNSYGNFIFAKNGEHFKTQTFAFRPWPLADKPDQFGNIDVAATMIDFERNHATAFVVTSDLTLNAPLKEEDISLPALEAMGR
ncbi:MAG: outer membrane lipoprotein-sorting protein, partial [Alphaproteobacteria bacterium]